MGDTTDPSSTAARGARDEDTQIDPTQPRSFWARLFGTSTPEPANTPSPEQSAMEAASDAGAREMLVNVREMRTLTVADVLVPRADIVALPKTATLEEIVACYRDSTMTRLPVFDETLDDPVGFLHLKDFALSYGFGAENDVFDIEPLIRRVLYVPPSMPLGALLQRMQSTRIHMALVIDEYGGVDGVVTIEDLVEQIVGDIEDEHDEEEDAPWREESPGVYIVNARAELHQFEEVAQVDLLSDALDEDVETMGGLVFMLLGRIPERAEIISHPDGHEFEVIDADARKIKRMRVRIKSDAIQRAAE